mgnify:CR=1 FL=1
MKPLNVKERRGLYWKFFALFLFTSATVVGAVYFDFSVPLKENKSMKEEMIEMEQSEDVLEEIRDIMNNISAKLTDAKSFDGQYKEAANNGAPYEDYADAIRSLQNIEEEIKGLVRELKEIQKKIPRGYDAYDEICTRAISIYETFLDEREISRTLRAELGKTKKNRSELVDDCEDVREELRDMERKFDNCKDQLDICGC